MPRDLAGNRVFLVQFGTAESQFRTRDRHFELSFSELGAASTQWSFPSVPQSGFERLPAPQPVLRLKPIYPATV
jgi:hypothetical protein